MNCLNFHIKCTCVHDEFQQNNDHQVNHGLIANNLITINLCFKVDYLAFISNIFIFQYTKNMDNT